MPPQDASRPTAAPRSQPKRTSHIALLISDHRKHSVLWNRWMYIAPYANRSAVARPRAIPIGESTLAWDTSPTSFLQPDGKLPTASGATDRCRQERAWHRPTRHNTSHAMRRLVSSTADVPGNHLDMKPKQELQVPPSPHRVRSCASSPWLRSAFRAQNSANGAPKIPRELSTEKLGQMSQSLCTDSYGVVVAS